MLSLSMALPVSKKATGGVGGDPDAPNAPILTWVTSSTVDPPRFNVDFDLNIIVGDTITAYVDGVLAATHVITEEEALALEIDLNVGVLGRGTYDIWIFLEHDGHLSPSSNVVTVTLDLAITSLAAVNCLENVQLAHALTANESVTWSLTGGADQARLELSGSTLRWLGNGVKDFETPNDSGANNTYVVDVRATSTVDASTRDQTITVTVTDVLEIARSYSYKGTTTTTTGNLFYTHTEDLGTAATDRYVLVAILCANATTPASIVCNSVTLNQLVNGNNAYNVSWYGGLVVLGSGSLGTVITFNSGASFVRRTSHIYTLAALDSTTPKETASWIGNVTSGDNILNAAIGDLVFALAGANDPSSTFATSDVVPNSEHFASAGNPGWLTAADWIIVSADASFELHATKTGAANAIAVAVSFA